MEDLNNTLKIFMREANGAIAAGDYITARDRLVRAAQCALLLAKGSSGAAQKQYLEKYASLKKLIEAVGEKIKSAGDPKPAKSSYEEQPPVPQERDTGDGGKPSYGGQVRFDNPLSPRRLCDYVGQPDAVAAVKDLISAALLKNTAMPHVILYGSHGLGKTTFAKIIAYELKADFIEINVSKITVPELIAIFKKIKPRDVIFIDEIHTLPTVVAESVLYSAMQDGKIVYNEGKGKFAKTVTLALPPFTLIGATTEIGKLAKPFTQRAIQIRLVEYSDEVLGGIISKSFYKLGMKITPDNALYVAKRCRNNPRVANNVVKRISDKALVRYAAQHNLSGLGALNGIDAIRSLGIEVTQQIIDDFFVESGIDEYGLEPGDRELLKIVITRYNGGPVGLDNLARALNESNNVIAQKYEAYLIKKGLYKVEREGRIVMPEGYRALGLPVPEGCGENKEGGDKTFAEPESGEPKLKYDKRKVTASLVPDGEKAEKIERLITYPENAAANETSLDELFPDISKEYEGETNHRCLLEIDFGSHKREIVCDSFLESRFATAMAMVGYLRDMKAQTVEIPYISQELANRRYFPDFVIKDYKGRIAVIEMKNYEMMSYHLNIDKYFRLREYCRERGYGYAEIMRAENSPEYVSVEDLINEPVNEKLQAYIIDTIAANGEATGEGIFTNEDFMKYVEENGATDLNDVYTILLNNRKLKNTDKAGGQLRIRFTSC